MSKWNIYHKDGSFLTDVNEEQITINGLEYSDSWMGECFVTISFKHNAPIKFEIGDYIMYRGERFELNYDPGKEKQARKDSYGEGFVYDSVKFNALQDELSRTEFLDVVLSDNQLHYTSLPKFSFYVETIDDLLDRIQANLDEQIGDGKWKIFSRNKERSMQRGCTEAEWNAVYGEGTGDLTDFESKSITVDSQNCWEALSLANTNWDINFIVRNRCVYVGTAGVMTQNIFKYGLGKGLYEIDQNADSDQSIITRLRAYGSEKNLPDHYYADLGSTPFLNVTGDYKASSTSTGLSVMLEDSEFDGMFTNVKSNNGSNLKHVIVSCRMDGYLFDAELELVLKEGFSCTTRLLVENNKTVADAVKAKIDAGFKEVDFLSGVKVTKFNSNRINYIQNLPNNMSINRLMLPGFPTMSLKEFWDTLADDEKKYVNPSGREHVFSTDKYRPYIDSINLEKIGLRSGSQFFDNDDKTNGVIDIYPTIEEMVVGGVRVDEIYTGSNVEDNGRFDDGQTVANIDIYLNPAIDFDINDLKNDDFSICMKDGMCGGRSFKVASCSKIDGKWRLTIERVKDDALNLWFPYKDYQIKKGDHFVLTGIELPDSYIRAASLKLLKYAIALLDKNDYTRYVYQPKVDEIFMARQHDKAIADKTGAIKSLHDTLKAGDIMQFEDDDLGIDAQITIDQLTIKEEDGSIPTYEITLREDKEVGTIQKIKQQISSLESGNGGNGGGLTTAQVKSQVASEGGKYFLSKLHADTAAGQITFQQLQHFLKGMKVGANDEYGMDENGNAQLSDVTLDRLHDPNSTPQDRVIIGAQGFEMYIGEDGKSHLYIDNLSVRNKLFAAATEIRKVSYAGGTTIFSNAGSTIAKVAYIFDAKGEKVIACKCYAKADDGTTATANWWKPGMMGLCQTFNIKAGVYEGVQNRYYWRLCVGAGQEWLDDGKLYDYFILSNVESFAGTDGVQPDSEPHILADEQGNLLQFDGVLVSIVSNNEYTSFAEILAAEGISQDDAGTTVSSRRFYGYDPASNAAPAVGDVVVNVGDQVRWNEYGNVIKLSTSTEDDSTATAPSIAMYHGIGAPRRISSTQTGTSVWQWKEMTSFTSPIDVMYNAKNFRFVTYTDEGDMIDVGSVYDAYELRGSYSSVVRATDGSYTPALDSILFSLSHRMGNHIEEVSAYELRATIDGKTYMLANKKLSDISNHLNGVKMVKLEALVDGETKAALDYPVMSDGTDGKDGTDGNDGTSVTISSQSVQYAISDNGITAPSSWSDTMLTATDAMPYLWTKTTVTYNNGSSTVAYSVGYKGKNGQNGKDGTSVNIRGTAQAHFSNYAEMKAASKNMDDYYIIDDVSGIESARENADSTVPCVVRYVNAPDYSYYVGEAVNGDGWLVDGELWVNNGSYWQNVGNIQGPQGEQGDPGNDGANAAVINVTPSTIVFDTDEDGNIKEKPKRATISIKQDGNDVPFIFLKTSTTNCEMTGGGNYVEITDVSTTTVKGKAIPCTSGRVMVKLLAQDGKTYIITIPFQVNINTFIGEVYWNNKELSATMTNIKSDLENGTSLAIDYGKLQLTAASNIFANVSGVIDSSGKVKKASEGGLVTQSDFAELFATAYKNDDKGEVKASLKAFVTKDDNGVLESGVSINADKININASHKLKLTTGTFEIDSGNFKIDASGNVSMTGKINATSGSIGGFEIGTEQIGLTSSSSSFYQRESEMALTRNALYLWSKRRVAGSVYNYKSSISLVPSYGTGHIQVVDDDVQSGSETARALIYLRSTSPSKVGDTYFSNKGLWINITGATKNDANIDSGNHALWLENGDIAGMRLNIQQVNSSYTITKYDNIVVNYATNSNTILQLPNASDCRGQVIFIINKNGYKCTIKGTLWKRGSSTSETLTEYGKGALISDGTHWIWFWFSW